MAMQCGGFPNENEQSEIQERCYPFLELNQLLADDNSNIPWKNAKSLKLFIHMSIFSLENVSK